MTDRRKTEPKEPEQETTEPELDEALEETFPASDPPAFATPHRNEPPPKPRRRWRLW
jgi:hypothetical protein